MRKYSDFFSTLYDEQQGMCALGAHYSVLRCVLWTPRPSFHDFAVIWDEDHDMRVTWVIEHMYIQGLLAPALAVGERKGGITVLTKSPPTEKYCKQIERISGDLPSDSFSSSVELFSEATGQIINARPGPVRAYLAGLAARWPLGTKDLEFTTEPFREGCESNARESGDSFSSEL